MELQSIYTFRLVKRLPIKAIQESKISINFHKTALFVVSFQCSKWLYKNFQRKKKQVYSNVLLSNSNVRIIKIEFSNYLHDLCEPSPLSSSVNLKKKIKNMCLK